MAYNLIELYKESLEYLILCYLMKFGLLISYYLMNARIVFIEKENVLMKLFQTQKKKSLFSLNGESMMKLSRLKKLWMKLSKKRISMME